MATKLRINYLRSSDLPGVGTTQKIFLPSDKIVEIKCHSTGGQILNEQYDFSSAVPMETSGESPNGYSDLIYRYLIEDDAVTLWLACVVSDDTALPTPDYQEYEITDFPRTIFLSEGITDGSEAVTGNPSWVADLNAMTYPQKQALAVSAIKAWRNYKEDSIVRSERYLDLNPLLPGHVAYWFRSADRVIQKFFQDPDVDPLIVAEMAKKASEGPTTIDDRLTLLRNLTGLIGQFADGPTFAAIWVETRNLSSPSDVTRKTIVEVLATRGTPADETYDLPADYDSTKTDWIVENQPGIVTYDNDSPASGEDITATLVDYDGGISNRRYRWQRQAQDGTWSNMSGAGNRNQTWTIGDAGTYRCRIIYNDNYMNGNEAFGTSFTIE